MKLIHLIIVAFFIALIFAALTIFTYIKVKAVENEFDVGCSSGISEQINVPASTIVVLTFDTEYFDTDDFHTIGESRYYIPFDGKYLAVGEVYFYRNGGMGECTVFVRKNSETTNYYAKQYVNGNLSTTVNLNGSEIMDLSAGDYLELAVYSKLECKLEIKYTSFSVERIGIGGDSMDMNIVLPTGFYVMIFGLGLIFISFFIKSPLINLAVIACMVSCIFEPAFKDTYYQTGCILLAIWSAIVFFVRISKVFDGGEQ